MLLIIFILYIENVTLILNIKKTLLSINLRNYLVPFEINLLINSYYCKFIWTTVTLTTAKRLHIVKFHAIRNLL